VQTIHAIEPAGDIVRRFASIAADPVLAASA